MSDLLRMTGMYSGMDTEAVIQQLVKAKAQKVTNLKNDQKKLEWKQTLWQDLNKRIYKLYTGTLSNMRLTGSYAKKKTSISDPTKATITASEGAVNGTQTLEVKQIAKAGYLTGATVSMKRKGEVPIYSDEKVNDSLDGVTPADKEQYIKEFGSEKTLEALGVGDGTLTVTANGKTFTVDAKKEDSIKDFIQKFNNAAAAATGGAVDIKMEYNKGKITVSGTDADAGFKMSSSAPSGSNKTILQGLGLADASENQTGTFIGHAITEKGDIYLPGDFKNYSEKDKDYKAKVSDITPDLVGKKLRLTVGTGADAKVTIVEITADMEIGTLTSKLSEGGVKASFDEQNQRFFISSTGTGNKNEFTLEGLDENNRTDDSALIDLGLLVGHKYGNGSESTRIEGQDAEIILNGAKFTSDTNTITVNGLSITASAVTDEEVTITTDTDYDGIYDMIKDFITEYNDIMNEMTKLYSAKSARKYTMLSDEEKEAMTDDEVEKWESTIKDSLLRRDKDLNAVMECMRGAVNKGYDIGGQTLFLVNFGVGTGSYFDTEKGERNALHIFGDSDDDKYSDKDNDLKAAIAKDPDQVIELFAAMSKDMYDSLQKTMASTDYRSIYKVYDDKRMKIDYDNYTKKIKEEEKKLNAFEDKWYKKFSAMEVALSKLQSSQNSLASMLGQ
ncbi:MAG: flagellar filament capping protein FliD [Lachnospiraceae bacterium]|jgi:flagellar hook-associated protein 2|nr:flagellar filament capping protein FliD [Lachnospiraceae bacterium]